MAEKNAAGAYYGGLVNEIKPGARELLSWLACNPAPLTLAELTVVSEIDAADIKDAIDEVGIYPSSVGIKNCSHLNEEIIPDINQLRKRTPDYCTLIIAKQKSKNGASAE